MLGPILCLQLLSGKISKIRQLRVKEAYNFIPHYNHKTHCFVKDYKHINGSIPVSKGRVQAQ